jgi:hypothetical protein
MQTSETAESFGKGEERFIKTRGREEKGERGLLSCLNHHRQSEFAGGRIICTSFVSSFEILMPSVTAICNRDESLHHASILPQIFPN